MRKPFAVAMALFLAFGNLLPIAQPMVTNAAPPPPVTPTLSQPPARLGATGQSSHTPPSPDKLSAQAQQARARQAIEAAVEKHLRYWGPRYQVAPVEVAVEGDWAHGVANWKSQVRTLKEPIHVLAHRLPDGTWQALMPETDGLYLQWLDAVPERLVPATAKSQLRSQTAEVDVLKQPKAVPIVPPPVATSEKPSAPAVSQPSGSVLPTPTPTAVSPNTVLPIEKFQLIQPTTDMPLLPTPTVVFRSSPITDEVVLTLSRGNGISQVGITAPITEQKPIGPEALRIGTDGRIYILDTVNSRILEYDWFKHSFIEIKIPGDSYLRDLAWDRDRLYVMTFDAVYAVPVRFI